MQPDLGFARWSIPLGTWFDVRVRMNIWFPLVLLLMAHWLGWKLGAICTALLLVIVLLHEFAHILAARRTGGDGREILLWPLGGLAFTRPANRFASQFLTPAAGPLFQLLLCAVTFPAVLQADFPWTQAINPAVLPIADISEHVVRDLLILTFSLSWVLLLINLIPAYPLDGGQMLLAVLSRDGERTAAESMAIRVGWFAGVLLMIGGLFTDITTIVFLGFFLIVMNLQELFRLQTSEMLGEGFGGEFTTSSDDEDDAPRLSFWQRWKRNRAAARHERELEERAATTRRVDELLDKVHREGMDSLTAEERRFLDRASSQYRPKHQS
jgi:stage IV sporulation protein FB